MARSSLKLIAAMLLPLAAGTLSAAAAQATPTWSAFQLPAALSTRFYGASCPTPTFCAVAGDENATADNHGAIATSTNPTAGAEAWNFSIVDPAAPLRGISCPSASLCVAVGPTGDIVTSTEPAGTAAAWTITPLPGAPQFLGVSCSVEMCVAVGRGGAIATSAAPTAGAWNVTFLAEPVALHGVSCIASEFCAAVDLAGDIYTTDAPISGAGGWHVTTQPAGLNSLFGISCPSASLCVTGNSENLLASIDPTGPPGTWKAIAPATGFQTTAVSCANRTACVAVDNDGTAISSTDPAGGSSTWTTTKVIPGTTNGLFAVSCQSPSLCIAAGSWGWFMTSTEPLELQQPAPRKPKRPRRPRVTFDHHPRYLVRVNHRRATVSFRFHATLSAKAFRCRIDDGATKPCHSPRRFHPNIGRHVFKVRAIGPTGLSGRAAIFHFRVTSR